MKEFIDKHSKFAAKIQRALRESGKADSTRVSVMRMWQGFGAYLYSSGVWADKHPIRVERAVRCHTDPDIQLDLGDIKRISEHIDTIPEPGRIWNRALLQALFPTLLRASEIVSITVGGVQGELVEILEKGYNSKTQTAINQDTRLAFLALRRRIKFIMPNAPKTFPLFPPPTYLEGRLMDTKAASVDTIQAAVEQWGEVIGKHLSPHDFRHSGITILLDMGTPVSDVAALSRHSADWIVKRYDRHVETRSRGAANVLQTMLKEGVYDSRMDSTVVGDMQDSHGVVVPLFGVGNHPRSDPGSDCERKAEGMG